MADIAALPSATQPVPQFNFMASRQFASWMAEQRVSIGFTTYQALLLLQSLVSTLHGIVDRRRRCG